MRDGCFFVEVTKMKINNPIRHLTKFEWGLWLSSVAVVLISFILSPEDYITLIASLIGVTALIFTAKGFVIGQILIVIFAVFYGVVSFWQRYYGEVITYLGMTAPIAILSVISWIKNPYKGTREVKVNRMNGRQVTVMLLFTVAVTLVFYFILDLLGNANLLVSTLSVTTSFLASYMTFMRSPYYAIGYAANDVVLIALWVAATLRDISCLPMVMCFVVFLINDLYGFISWRRMEKRQLGGE
ncbi:MAG: nicotinamide mononucleotide transporter [Clostridia bacterium]|nr:nicotinamide mononucleotide transporter [Clostridia bacterium]